ncbi:hypothetical protein [Candidatus Leptofilum sp.]|uniref:hypothetical protein n=1 Tax=Candidatus Leptofilum sp. TaxID=3241576 RepID=UPI003B5C8936
MTQLRNLNLEIFRRRESLWVLLLFGLLTTIAAWDIVTDLNGVIVGDDNDAYISVWANWWTARALADPNTSLWQTDMIFAPLGADLTFHSFSHLNTLVTLGLRPFLGELPAHNLTVLLNYVLAGLSMYHLAKHQTKSTMAGILAGIVFAFNSQNLYQSTHPNFVSVWCFPWITLFFIRAVQEDSIKFAIVAAFFVFLGAATSTVLVILMVFWLGILTVYLWVAKAYPRPSLRILFSFAGLSGLLILPLVWPQIQSAFSTTNGNAYLLDPNQSIGTDIISVFLPTWWLQRSADSGFLPPYIIETWVKRGMYLGIAPFYLAMIALNNQRQRSRLWFILLLVIFLFAIGPIPAFVGISLKITLPWTLPVAPVLRQMYRMMILFTMGWAMVVAYGWIGFRQQLKKPRAITTVAFILIGLAIFVDYTAVPFPHRPSQISAFYTDYLKDIPDDITLATLPTGRQEDKRYMYYQTYHQHPIVNGMVARSSDANQQFIEANPLLRAGAVDLDPVDLPDDPETAIQQLTANQIGFLIIDKQLIDDVDLWRDYLPLPLVFEDASLLAYSTGFVDE